MQMKEGQQQAVMKAGSHHTFQERYRPARQSSWAPAPRPESESASQSYSRATVGPSNSIPITRMNVREKTDGKQPVAEPVHLAVAPALLAPQA